MPDWVGSLTTDGSPSIKIVVRGSNGFTELNALIDTGFSGFCLIPRLEAQSIGLFPSSEHRLRFVNGASSVNPSLPWHIEVDGEVREGALIFDTHSKEAIIGMEALRTFRRVLFLHPNLGIVRLFEQDHIDMVFAALVTNRST